MHAAAATTRLAASLGVVVLGWSLSCRPAWSPDSEQVAFIAVEGDSLVLARHRVGQPTAAVAYRPPEQAKACMAAAWLADGAELLVLSSASEKPPKLRVVRIPLAGGAPREFVLDTTATPDGNTFFEPVVVDGRLLLGGRTLRRLDLETGAVTEAAPEEAPAATDVIVAPRGEGAGYIWFADKKDQTRWEIGAVDPESLTRTALLRAPEGNPWLARLAPAFHRDGARVALPVMRPRDAGHDLAVQVFDGGERISSVRIDDADSLGPFSWAPDGVTLVGTAWKARGGARRLELVEVDFAGNRQVRTELLAFRGKPKEGSDDGPGLMLQASVSPDGRYVALTTAAADEDIGTEQRGLLLVDRTKTPRTVTRVPFPE